MRKVWAVKIIEVLSGLQLLIQVDISSIREKLIELIMIGPVGSLYLPVQLGSPGFDVHMILILP